jgi:hypothetical protein
MVGGFNPSPIDPTIQPVKNVEKMQNFSWVQRWTFCPMDKLFLPFFLNQRRSYSPGGGAVTWRYLGTKLDEVRPRSHTFLISIITVHSGLEKRLWTAVHIKSEKDELY